MIERSLETDLCICRSLILDKDAMTESVEKEKLEKLFIYRKKNEIGFWLTTLLKNQLQMDGRT